MDLPFEQFPALSAIKICRHVFTQRIPGIEVSAEKALVVVLDGCTQTAAGYDRVAGWSTVADRFGFALLLPETDEFEPIRVDLKEQSLIIEGVVVGVLRQGKSKGLFQ